MLRILEILGANLRKGPSTVRLPGSAPVPQGFRGPVLIDAARCLACGMCSYVCASEAIAGREEEGGYGWSYDLGRCTFCARCVERCPGRALAMDARPAPAYARREEAVRRVQVDFPACLECGTPSRPATPELARLAFERPGEETLGLMRLCERCRRKRLQRQLFEAGQGKEGRR